MTSCIRVRGTTPPSTGRRSAPRPRQRWCLRTVCPASSGGVPDPVPAPEPTPVTGGGGTSTISYPNPSSGNPSLVGDDTGREVTSITIGGTPVTYGSTAYNTDFANGLFVGTVSDTGELYPANSGGPTVAASFQAVDDAGNPVTITGTVTSVTLSAEGDPLPSPASRRRRRRSLPTPCSTLWTRRRGGGDTGSVLISPFISPGSVSTTNYNHYSWLRTMEDLFDVSELHRHPDGRHLSLRPGLGLRRSRRPGPHRLRGPDRPGHVRVRRLHRTEWRTGSCPPTPPTPARDSRSAAGRGLSGRRPPGHGRLRSAVGAGTASVAG